MEENTNKLLYEFPPKLSRAERQAKAVHDLQEHKKMRSNMYRNIILGAVIFGISFLSPVALVKILLMLIAVGNIVTALLLYRFYALSRDTEEYTRIYADRFEHCQVSGLSGKKLCSVIYFDEIESSNQNNRGRLVVKLRAAEKSAFKTLLKNDEEAEYIPENNTVTLFFADTKSKLKLIDDFYEHIKYPHKEYNKIDDEDGDGYYSKEDMEWDKLHKHGL